MMLFLNKSGSLQETVLLIEVLETAKKYLALPDNDYSCSSWRDARVAIDEMNNFIFKISLAQKIDVSSLEVIFAPTGLMQEVSLSSGWGDAFLDLAERFDEAMKLYKCKNK